MKRFIFCLSICCFVCLSGVQIASAQSSGIAWEKHFGTPGKFETANDICYSSDVSVYVTAGYQLQYNQSNPSYSAYITLTDSGGNPLWSGTYRGPNNDRDCMANSVATYYDRYEGANFLVTGTIWNSDGSRDIFLVKYKLVGWNTLTKVWEKTCLGDSSLKAAYKIALVGYSYAPHFVITGETDDNKMCLLEVYASNCDIVGTVYTMDQSGISSSVGYGVVELDHANFYVCGKAVLTDGNTQAFWIHVQNWGGWWTRWMGPLYFGGSNEDIGYAIAKGTGASNATIIAGKYGSSPTNSDYWLLTVDSEGRKIDEKTWGDAGRNEELHSIEASNGDKIIAGMADMDPNPSVDHYNAYLARVGSSNTMQWSKYFGDTIQHVGGSFVRAAGYNTWRNIGLATGKVPGTIGNGDVYVVKYAE